MRPNLSVVLLVLALFQIDAEAQIIIAHRGASGYLPEHTLAAKAMAHQMGVDYIEQDVVLTKDAVPIVLHDIQLDTVSDVATRFPERARRDGRFYAIDFTLQELKTLRLSERMDLETAKAVFPGRFPAGLFLFPIPTLAEEITLIQGLNKSTGREVGIYTEIKSPSWHRAQGLDISRIVLHTLRQFGYENKDDKAFVQCFDEDETRRLREELGTNLRLVQLLSEKQWRDRREGAEANLQKIAKYADGIGPALSLVINGRIGGNPRISNLTTRAKDAGLIVHPYTVRTDQLPEFVKTNKELVEVLFRQAGVDGVFTDQPDLTMAAAAVAAARD